MKIFTYAGYDVNRRTLGYVADAVEYYTGRRAKIADMPQYVPDEISLYYYNGVPVADTRGLWGCEEFNKTASQNMLYVSVSHCDSRLVIGLADTPIGVDIEKIVFRKNYKRIAAKIGFGCASTEQFYEGWTEYECRIKADGSMRAYAELFGVRTSEVIVNMPPRRYEVFADTILTIVGGYTAEFIPMEAIYADALSV